MITEEFKSGVYFFEGKIYILDGKDPKRAYAARLYNPVDNWREDWKLIKLFNGIKLFQLISHCRIV